MAIGSRYLKPIFKIRRSTPICKIRVKRLPKLDVLDAVFGGFSTPYLNNLILIIDFTAILGHVRKGEFKQQPLFE